MVEQRGHVVDWMFHGCSSSMASTGRVRGVRGDWWRTGTCWIAACTRGRGCVRGWRAGARAWTWQGRGGRFPWRLVIGLAWLDEGKDMAPPRHDVMDWYGTCKSRARGGQCQWLACLPCHTLVLASTGFGQGIWWRVQSSAKPRSALGFRL
jgi:hypothetical protein